MGFLSSLMTSDIGIDLGTANILIWVRGEGVVINEPSIVAMETKTRRVLAVGAKAKEMVGRTPGEIVTIRPLREGVIADFEVTEEMLRVLLKRVIKNRFLVRPRIVVGVPSGITEVEKRAVRLSAERVNARDVHLVSEPMAGAIGVGIDVHAPIGSMIIDIGGGTSEIAVIALSGIVNGATSIRIGGDKFDEAIVQYLKKNYNLLIGERTAEQIKKEIGSACKLEKEIESHIKGRDLVAAIPRTISISSVEIREAIAEPTNAITDAVMLSLERTPPEVASDILDRGIILTGGGALLRGLDIRFREETSLPVHVAEDPLTCVVRGTGKILENISDYRKVLF
ncbi:MAG: rod shape-determining protein [Candidatus Latescibacteria bacterium]|jgi:rod shape-determining protein MreB and related proteins|nr:rod shape-determining protein [Candidatus Latescibacterota bacterium]